MPKKTFTKRIIDCLVGVAEDANARPGVKLKAIDRALELDRQRKKQTATKAATAAEKSLGI